MRTLRQAVIKLASDQHQLRKYLAPLLRKASEQTFEDAVKGQKFRNPETGNEVTFGALPADEQKKLRAEWSKKHDKKDNAPAKSDGDKLRDHGRDLWSISEVDVIALIENQAGGEKDWTDMSSKDQEIILEGNIQSEDKPKVDRMYETYSKTRATIAKDFGEDASNKIVKALPDPGSIKKYKDLYKIRDLADEASGYLKRLSEAFGE